MLLKSGKELKITLAPFAQSKALLQALMEEAKGVHLTSSTEIDISLFKEMLCTAVASKRVEEALGKCMERALYCGVKIGPDTFEPAEAREDYLEVCFEVAKENILPFTKSLSAQFAAIRDQLRKGQA